ncbi:hypothetical protein NBO_546g0002 [Nosema bombycis CQ1]|uniref:Uncharacterized protein n=1 Tax=Nosema bombycis (strain CQ1 / CVCC 102059) TaxID=578461 RepID=R0MH45_NOSB1|nr:hypothetical protein NBO_546g0002 [Nosema bombycis CQ1]|eukprot:EOB12113.1 hypothetical protein NBO_546g0002 [Nosema bombycis CQ1]
MDESKQKSAWKDFEHIMMFNGLMRYSTEHTLFLNVQKDLVYGFVIYRPYTNSIRDSFRIQKNKIKIATIKKAIDWEPSRYPIETLLRNIDKDSELFKIYSELYKVDCHKFSKITRENLNSFMNFLKKEKVKAKILKEISKLNIAPVSEDKGRQFIEANYISLHTSYKEIYVLENCPEVDLIETVKEPTKEEDKVECKTQDETIQWLIKKVLSHDVTLSNISSTIPMVMNEIGMIKETDKPETEENNHLILLDFIKKSFKKNEKFTSSELLKKNKKIKKTEECIEILNELVENGDIFKITEKFLRNSTATKYFY